MGQTLTNGIFLPNEGERNCYTGLAGNWRAIDGYIGDYNVHVADAVIHVSQADRDKWGAVTGKADASALTAHTGDTTIHVTAEDKNKWDAVTTKANDADVMHKSGAETIAGIKTFNDNVYITTLNHTNEVASPASSNSSIMALINAITYADSSPSVQARLNFRITADGSKSVYPHESNQYSLGLTSRIFKEFYTYSLKVTSDINSNSPGALSLPNLSAGVDISGYITLGTYHQDTYTPPSDGYISIMIYGSSASGLFVYSGSFGTGMRSIGGHPIYGQVCCIFLPVRAGTTYTIENTGATNIGWAYFYPCQGNV